MAAAYDYLFLDLGPAATPHQALAAQLKALPESAELVGQFAPQLGWANNQAAALIRWLDGERGALRGVVGGPIVVESRVDALVPTIRPPDGAWPDPGGIYVHRWFEVEMGAVDEFVDLSGQGWARFESLFDARIFGLFRAADDAEGGFARLLLLTRYGDHGVWEASRDPSTEAMRIFVRRQQLTRRSWAASSRLLA